MLALSASSANAGNFFQLTEGAGGVLTTGNGGLKNGVQNANADPFYIITTSATYLPGLDISNSTGDIVASVLNYQTFNRVGTTNVPTGTGTLNLLDYRVTTGVDLAPGSAQADIYDFVYRDSTDNSLVFATRYLNRQDNNEEANYLYRYNFTLDGYNPQVAWTFSGNNDLRMYQAGLTDDHSFNASVPFQDNVVRQKGDFSVSEGNPWSGLFLVKTNATAYELGNKAIGFYQAGEEGQAVVGGFISGYVAAVPEPDTYAMMLAGLGLMGFVARRRRENV
ncbi:MAG TPA: FxDxF family PEP-CTERM protein [Methylotenera sp.]|nr:FxDxF family PEP-CTERM protein [Methylotenera sp.]